MFLPSTELSEEQGNDTISANNTIKLGFFGQFRKEKNIERFIDAFVSLNYDNSVQLVVQGATVKPEDGELFESIIKKI